MTDSFQISQMEEKPSTVIYKGMPDVFVLGNVELFTNKLMDTLERYRLDEVTLSKIVAYKSLALWNAGKAFNNTLQNFRLIQYVLNPVSSYVVIVLFNR